MQDFRNLKVWEKGHALTLAVYDRTTTFPKHEMFALTNQIRRAASSIPMNLAEGCGRGSDAEFGRFLQIAMGSACEVEYQLLLARDLAYLPAETYMALHGDVLEIKRMLSALIGRVKG
jgi:four helix bundle protein